MLVLLLSVACSPRPSPLDSVFGDDLSPDDSSLAEAAEAELGAQEQITSRLGVSARAIYGADGRFVAQLPRLGLTTSFTQDGVEVQPAGQGGSLLRLKTLAWGRADRMETVRPATPALGACSAEQDAMGDCVQRLEYNHGDMTEWWVTVNSGLEQGWTVDEAPMGRGPIRFEVGVPTGSVQRSAADGLHILDSDGRAWSVHGVSAWDALGEPLPASAWEEDGRVVVTVDDHRAQYPITVDPLYTSSAWLLTSAYDGYGSAAAAGDVNGDGYTDLLLSMPKALNLTGWVYLFEGASGGISSDASQRLEGLSTSSQFGVSLAVLGDVNGDGYNDAAIGANYSSADSEDVYIHLGGSGGLSTSADTVLSAPSSKSGFGTTISAAGDVNSDGYNDLIVGAYLASRAYIYLGSSAGMSSSATTTLAGTGYFGYSLAGVGDVNGDGYDDVAVGQYTYSSNLGQVTVYHGAATGPSSTASTTLTGTSTSGRLGYSVAGAGDVNADGYDDLLIGAPGVTSYTGRAYVHNGSTSGISASVSTTLVGFATGDYFGYAVAGAGDVDKDGYDDVAVGAPYYGSYGQLKVFHGTSSGTFSVAKTTITPSGSFDNFTGLTPLGDSNGDGYDDLLYFADGNQSDSFDAGHYVLRGKSTGMATSVSQTFTEDLPYAVTDFEAAGDVNGDGFQDIGIVDSTGRGFLYLGDTDGVSDEPLHGLRSDITKVEYTNWTAAGDVNGDGYADALLADKDGGTSGNGVAVLHLGSSAGLDLLGSGAWQLEGKSGIGANIGESSAAGDVNNDGYTDILIGAPNSSSSSYTSYVHLYTGSSAGLGSKATYTYSGIEKFGAAICLGQFDFDSNLDMAVGAPLGSSTAGDVKVYYGTTTGPIVLLKTLTGEATGDDFGTELSCGDVNGDGYDDLLVGSPDYDTNKGRIYVYFGSATGPGSLPNQLLTGASGEDYGSDFQVVGDLDGDGYDDLVVAVEKDNSNTGRLDIYSGGAAGLNTSAPVVIYGSKVGGYFGKEFRAAGDINDDGFADVLVQSSDVTELFYGYDVDTDGDGHSDSIDCDDTDATIHPGAAELCDGVDQDCDGTADEGVTTTFFADADGDGYGRADKSLESCASAVSGYVEQDGDCDDGDASVSPAGTESCDGVDNNCDGDTDEDGAVGSFTVYIDADADGYGGLDSREVCAAPSGTTSTSTDCDDDEASVSPGASERCNSIDDDCDGDTDEAGALGEVLWYLDADNDGEGDAASAVSACTTPAGYVANAVDCDDDDSGISTASSEVCNDVDDDCDGSVDDGVLLTWYRDADADGSGGTETTQACSAPTGYLATSTDCDDSRADVYIGAPEQCDGVDQDCDTSIDEGAFSTFYIDEDGDGFGGTNTVEACEVSTGTTEDSTDCDDDDATIHPDALEVCDDLDQNCDGEIDEGVTTTFYRDADKDGYGTELTQAQTCEQPDGYVSSNEDCDDQSAGVYPGAMERCDEVDNDCDTEVDEQVESLWYRDSDGDGLGWATDALSACEAPEGYVGNAEDCDDDDIELGLGVTSYVDADGDGYGDAAQSSYLCAVPSGSVEDDTDCDDSLASVHPDAIEVWYDGIDQNCDGRDDDQDEDGLLRADDCDDTDPNVGACPEDEDTGEKSGDKGRACSSSETEGLGAWWSLAALLVGWRRRASVRSGGGRR
ncbi:MAG: FG-GAP repeat protein [Deltaproteobacteria bacterium]|nr:FG-GAP repeat protein [Deltaproteobacteria bacterium]